MSFIVIGGGYFGSYHTRQLLKAMRRGKVPTGPLLVVDRDADCAAAREFAAAPEVRLVVSDWRAFLLQQFPDSQTHAGDQIVPAPYAPHLLYDWLAASVQAARPGLAARRAVFDIPLGLPYELTHEGNRFISAAGWQCPATCIEPAACPAIRAPRTWELGEIVQAHATPAQGISAVEVFQCRHYAYGVGTIPARRLLEARQHVLEAAARGGRLRVAVATVSSCHGVVAVLELAPPLICSSLKGRHPVLDTGAGAADNTLARSGAPCVAQQRSGLSSGSPGIGMRNERKRSLERGRTAPAGI